MTVTRLPASQARERFSEILSEVAYGNGRIVLQRHGKDVAAVISAEDLKRFEELEDRADLLEMEQVLKKGEPAIPWDQAKAKLGVK
ncbi:MAG: prevent-host-death family protein [Gemmatimonadetes bacterium]|nr:prevent-host-death family protein [Gemmatimonadota bacterium]